MRLPDYLGMSSSNHPMKTYNPLRLCVLALFSLAFVIPAQAEDAEKKAPSKRMLKKYDLNKDGVISADEEAKVKAKAKMKRAERRAALLAKYDVNKDGKINKSERAVIKVDRAKEKAAKKIAKAKKKAAKKIAKAEKKAAKEAKKAAEKAE